MEHLIEMIILGAFYLGIITQSSLAGGIIADYTIANEATLRAIPDDVISDVRNNTHIVVQGTSHAAHIHGGMFGLADYKSGDDVKFGISATVSTTDNKLSYKANVIHAGNDIKHIADSLDQAPGNFLAATRSYLDNPANADISVVLWAWCDIVRTKMRINGEVYPIKVDIPDYLAKGEMLIKEYGVGGSKIGKENGQRVKPVTFIFCTGHGWSGKNIGTERTEACAKQIVDFCKKKGYYCFDYYSIESHDMAGKYYPDSGLQWSVDPKNTDTYSKSYGGDYNKDWQDVHTLGKDWFYARDIYRGKIMTRQGHIGEAGLDRTWVTSNRHAYALWWILARISGWSPDYISEKM